MKQFYRSAILLFFGILSGLNSAFASHIMGVDITYTCLSSDTYVFTLTVYRDCSGISPPTSYNLDFSSVSCGENFSVNLPQIGSEIDVSAVCPTATTTCAGGTLPGTEAWTYQAQITLPDTCSDWIASWNSCCRNPAITNLDNPGSRDTYVQVSLDNTGGLCNNSPQYASLPVPYICAGQLFTYNHGAFDIDGDSLVYSLAQPLELPGPPGTPIPYATGGYTITNPVLNSGGFNFNPLTGEMCFTPNQQQQNVVSVIIEEYRNGVLIATHIREMQVIVSSTCSNQPPSIGTGGCNNVGGLSNLQGGPSVSQLDSNYITMCPDDSVCFDLEIFDPNGDNVTVTSNLATSIPGATLTVDCVCDTPTATFCWVPTAADTGISTFTVNLQDDACPILGVQNFTFAIGVWDATSAGPDQTVCGPNSLWPGQAQLQAIGGTQFVWSVITGDPIQVGVNFSCDSCDNPLATPDSTTIYEVASNLAAGCKNKDTVTVFVVPDFTYTMTQSDSSVCLGEAVQFTVTPTPAGAYTYNWFPSGVWNNDTASSPIATFNTPGIQTVYFDITSPDGCLKSDTFQVSVSTGIQPNITVLGDTTVCLGDSTQLSAQQIGANTTCNYIINMLDAGCNGWNGASLDFYVNGTLASSFTFATFACSESDSIQVAQGDSLEIIFTSGIFPVEESYQIVDGDGNIVFSDGPLPAQGSVWTSTANCGMDISTYTYLWAPSIWLSDTATFSTWVNPLSDTTYTIIVTDSIGLCSDTETVNIYVVPSFTYTNSADTAICLLEDALLSVTPDSAGNYTYSWSPTSYLDNDSISNPTAIAIDVSGTHVYTFFVTDSSGCTKTDTITVLVSNGAVPDLVITGDTTVCVGDSTLLSASFNISTPPFCGLSSTSCGGNDTLLVGTGTGQNTGTSYPAPYGNWYWGAKHQILYRASELNAMGFFGGQISEISFDVASISGATVYDNFEINMGCTNDSVITTWLTGLSTVYPAQTHNVITGWNTHTFATSYDWDGVSNIVVEVCFNNTSFTNNSITYFTTTSYTSVIYFRADNATVCPSTLTTGISADRPNTRFTGCKTSPTGDYTYVWSPSTWLSNDTSQSVYSTPISDTSYTLTIVDTIGGCGDTASVNIYVVPPFTYTTSQTDTAVCLFEQVQFDVVPDDSTFTYTYAWTPTNVLDTDSVASTIATYTTPGTAVVYFTIENDSGCAKTDSFIVEVSPGVQPNIVITGDTTICVGETTQLFANSSTVGVTFNDDFDPIDNSLWSNLVSAGQGSGCGSMSGDALFFNGTAPREATTIGVNVISGGTIDFCLFFGNDLSAGGCENADINEDLDLQYSTDGGATWILIQTFLTSDWDTGGPYANIWQCFSIPIPAAAQTTNTMFQWYQGQASGTGFDNLSIDNVSISSSPSTYLYSWLPSIWLSDDSIFDPLASPLSDTTYTVTIVDSVGGCSDTASINLYVVPDFGYVMAQTDTNICLFETIQFSVIPDTGTTYTYSWTPIPPVNTDFIFNPTATFNTSGTNIVYFDITSAGGCTKTDSFTVQVAGVQPDITITGDTIICEGDTSQLTAFNNATACTYTVILVDNANDGWDNASIDFYINGVLYNNYTISIAQGDSNIISIPVSDGDFIEIDYIPGNFEIEHSYFVYDPSGALIFSDGPNPIAGIIWSVTASCGVVSSTYIYEWLPSAGLNSVSIENPLASPDSTTTYQVIVTDSIGGCADTASVTILVNPVPQPVLTMQNTFCANDPPATFTATPAGGTWSGGGISTGGTFDPSSVAANTYTITYQVVQNGCAGFADDTVSVFSVPNTPVVVVDTPYCENEAVQLVSSTQGGTTYWFSDSTLTDTLQQGVTYNFSATNTSYYVIEVSSEGCVSATHTVTIIAISSPDVSFDADYDQNSPYVPLEVDFENNSDDNLSFDWNFGDGSSSSNANPDNIYENAGSYLVKLTGTDSNGCESIDTLLIVVEENPEIKIPNVFTPNGDNKNDVFIIDTKGTYTNVIMIIYNRWGRRIYECGPENNVNACVWDGTKNNGQLASDGTYFYVVTLNDKDGNPVQETDDLTLKGTVTLIRN